MTHTDTQLKTALAKMLPDMIKQIDKSLYWKGLDNERGFEPCVLDTELLHLCWLVEEQLNSFKEKQFNEFIDYDPHATWQQRTIALCKVKGVEIV